MEITRRTDYAIRILMELAPLPEGDVISARRLGQLQDVPPAFARSIVQQLVGAGFLSSRRGALGGVSLARPAQEISLLQVVEAMEGPLSLNLCTLDPGYCSRPGSCAMHEVWKEAEARLMAYLGSWDFGALAVHQATAAGRTAEADEWAPAMTGAPEGAVGPGPLERTSALATDGAAAPAALPTNTQSGVTNPRSTARR